MLNFIQTNQPYHVQLEKGFWIPEFVQIHSPLKIQTDHMEHFAENRCI
jgi:hypothetical protein